MKVTTAAVCIRPRWIAIAIFEGIGLEHIRLRELRSSLPRAMDSVTEIARRTFEQFDVNVVALQSDQPAGSIAETLTGQVADAVRECSISLHCVSYASLFEAFGIPPLKTRHQLRKAILGIWPALAEQKSPLAMDAAAAGLFLQIESLLDINLKPT